MDLGKKRSMNQVAVIDRARFSTSAEIPPKKRNRADTISQQGDHGKNVAARLRKSPI
jgi:hypothetical protein